VPVAPASLRALVLDFLRGSAALFVRSLTLQLTFNAALAVAARRGTSALAAHGAAAQLWLATSYTVDGLESAAVVLGSRIAAAADGEEGAGAAAAAFRALAARLYGAGVTIGLAAGAVMLAFPSALASLFLSDADPGARAMLRAALPLLAAAQPLCAATFVSDGLVYAVHAFPRARDVMLASFLLLFAPVLGAGVAAGAPGIAFIWGAKAAHNAGRLGGNAVVVWWWWRRRRGDFDV
jgi:MATE family multidrug resistance protein